MTTPAAVLAVLGDIPRYNAGSRFCDIDGERSHFTNMGDHRGYMGSECTESNMKQAYEDLGRYIFQRAHVIEQRNLVVVIKEQASPQRFVRSAELGSPRYHVALVPLIDPMTIISSCHERHLQDSRPPPRSCHPGFEPSQTSEAVSNAALDMQRPSI